jgi:hypothetical protein
VRFRSYGEKFADLQAGSEPADKSGDEQDGSCDVLGSPWAADSDIRHVDHEGGSGEDFEILFAEIHGCGDCVRDAAICRV